MARANSLASGESSSWLLANWRRSTPAGSESGEWLAAIDERWHRRRDDGLERHISISLRGLGRFESNLEKA